MSRMPLNAAVGALLAALSVPAAPASAQNPAYVRVAQGPVRIQEWYRRPDPQVLLVAETGTILAVLDKDDDWFWVVVPPDGHGTRRAGWVRAASVEAYVPPAASMTPHDAAEPMASATPAARVQEDRVTITTSRAEASSTGANAAAVYTFDDVHFDRDRYALRQEDVAILRQVAAALDADPSLVVNIEGYTCSLGGTAYNLGLGLRRANAVKSYLVSEGIPADRLHTSSLGEDHAKHDNSREETRQLNRRVALVPAAQP
jgi:outer membrane protein OmpA-like peptidoglycan-associated protein